MQDAPRSQLGPIPMCADHRGWTQSGRTCGLAKGKVVTTFKAKPFVADDTQTNPVISLHWLESTGTEPRVLPPTLPGFRALWVVPITLHPRLGPHFPLLDSLPPPLLPPESGVARHCAAHPQGRSCRPPWPCACTGSGRVWTAAGADCT